MPQLDINIVPNIIIWFIISFLSGYSISTHLLPPKIYRNPYIRRELISELLKISELGYNTDMTISLIMRMKLIINDLREKLINQNYEITQFINILTAVKNYTLLNRIVKKKFNINIG